MPVGTNLQLELFLRYLFPWEADSLGLYKGVSWTWPDRSDNGKLKFANYTAQTIDQMVHLIESRAARPMANTYVALGTMRVADTKLSSDSLYFKARRKLNNIVSLNSIYLDLDVKPGAYATTEEAGEALDDFIAKTGLPPTTMEVLSGSGGMHAYWCTKDPIPIAQWIPLSIALRDAALAFGLKFDPAVTVNAAGILRAPNTWNFKTVPPGKVTLLEDTSFTRYTYADLARALPAQSGQQTMLNVAGAGGGTRFSQNFIDNTPSAPPIPLDAVRQVCGVVADIVDRGGDGDAEPLWNLALMLASFTDDPVTSAHRMSSGDKRYVPADTERKLQEKINARAQNPNIGWPQCVAFSPLHKACRSCPLFVQNKSPLNHAPRPIPPAAAALQQAMAQHADPLMPDGYSRDLNKRVWTTVADEKGNSHVIDVLNSYPVYDAGIDPTTGHLVVRTLIGGEEHWGHANISGNQQPMPCIQALSTGIGIHVPAFNAKHTRDFTVAWMTKLQAAKKQIRPTSYGWTDKGEFVFDESIYSATGRETTFRGATLDKRFTKHGELQPWLDAMQLIYGKPALETLVATAFAAPLVELAGPVSLVVSAYSSESGVGKTTALQLAQAVWGDPFAGMSSLSDTNNSVMKKIQDLKSLPIYWDELRTKGHLEKAIELVFSVTQGKAKSRLTRDITQAEAGSFKTMFCVASNYGIASTVYSNTEGTEAGGLRVFEIRVPPFGSQISNTKSRQLTSALDNNFGVAGAQFAEHIAKNRKDIKAALAVYSTQIEQQYKLEPKERFWTMTMATLMVGAAVANDIGLTRFNLPAIAGFLNECITMLRSEMVTAQDTTLSDPGGADALLRDMIAEARGRNLVMTDFIQYRQLGRPMPAKLIDTDPSKLDEVWIQVGVDDGRIRVVKRKFDEWMVKRGYNPKQVIAKLEKTYVVVAQGNKQAIGAGIPWLNAAAMRRYCYDFAPLTSPGSSPGSS